MFSAKINKKIQPFCGWIDIYYNRFLIDAKSILGILSMDLTKVLTVDCHGENKEFERTLQKFAVA